MVKIAQLKNFLRPIKLHAQKLAADCVRRLPISSEYIGPPKGYYLSSKEYWLDCRSNSSIDAFYALDRPSSISKRITPKSIDKNVHWKFDQRYLQQNPETYVSVFPNGRVVGDAKGIIAHNDRLIMDVSRQIGVRNNRRAISLSHKVLNSLNLPSCHTTDKTMAVLAFAGGHNFFHWMTEGLPRLEILRRSSLMNTECISKYVVNKGLPAIEASLQMLGIHKDKLFFADSKQCHIKAKKLIVPSFPGPVGDPPLWVCDFLRAGLLRQRKPAALVAKRLYVSRAKATYRTVVNEKAVVSCLEKAGFTTVFLEDYDLATQISLFFNAEVVVAPHGAGLTHLMWCTPGMKVLELFSPNYVNVCFWAIANQVKLDYFYLMGEGQSPPIHVDPHIMTDSISVSVEKLRQTLDHMGI